MAMKNLYDSEKKSWQHLLGIYLIRICEPEVFIVSKNGMKHSLIYVYPAKLEKVIMPKLQDNIS